MYQEFNKVTTVSNLIKNLLISTYLPLIRTVRDFDYIIADRLYVYKCDIIKCTKSGYIVTGYQYANFDGDRAKYRVITEYYFGERNDKLCTNYVSNSEGYDAETHERLGKYLRNLRDMYDLNLMPLYNCFSNEIFEAHHIYCSGDWERDKIEKTVEDYNTKIYKIPIRFNTDYTICMENAGLTTFAPAFIKNGNLIKLNNNRFGNDVDVTNKYTKLYRTSNIYNLAGLNFFNPVKIRFNNIPVTRTVTEFKKEPKELDAQHSDRFYKVATESSIKRAVYYIRNNGTYTYTFITQEEYEENPINYYFNDNGVITNCDASMPFDIDRCYYVFTDASGFTYLPTALIPKAFMPEDATPEEQASYTDDILYVGVSPRTGRIDTALSYGKNYLIYVPEEKKLIQNMKPSDKVTLTLNGSTLLVDVELRINYDSANYRTVCLWTHCTDESKYDSSKTYYTRTSEEFKEWHYNITSTDYGNGSRYYIFDGENYINCEGIPYDPYATYYIEYLENFITVSEYYFIFHQTEFYISDGFDGDPSDYYKIVENELKNCTKSEVFDINTTYAIEMDKEKFTWRVLDGLKLVDSSDDYIHEGTTYYAQYELYTPIQYVYDITEENCAMYDYIEDNLYLLIQVPKDYDQNIVVLEGDYTNTVPVKIIDDSEVDLLPRPMVDYLYTSNLKLMELNTKQIIPFSKALVEFLLWNVINNLDSINNNMDRLAGSVSSVIGTYDFQSKYINYWYPDFRKLVHEIGRDFNNKLVRDNLGYVTRNLEEVIETTYNSDSIIPDYVDSPNEGVDE